MLDLYREILRTEERFLIKTRVTITKGFLSVEPLGLGLSKLVMHMLNNVVWIGGGRSLGCISGRGNSLCEGTKVRNSMKSGD